MSIWNYANPNSRNDIFRKRSVCARKRGHVYVYKNNGKWLIGGWVQPGFIWSGKQRLMTVVHSVSDHFHHDSIIHICEKLADYQSSDQFYMNKSFVFLIELAIN